MTNKEFQELLSQYPNDIKIKLLPSNSPDYKVIDFTEENILHTSETAWIKVGEADTDIDDEIDLGDGEQYLLLNPIVF